MKKPVTTMRIIKQFAMIAAAICKFYFLQAQHSQSRKVDMSHIKIEEDSCTKKGVMEKEKALYRYRRHC